MNLTTRNQLPNLFSELDLKIGVEVGVLQGEFSKHILSHWPGFLVMVDCWDLQPTESYHDVANVSQAQHQKNFEAAQKVKSEFNGRCDIIKSYSVEAAKQLRSQRRVFDWVYLDANHSREAVEEDLLAWYPLVKPGGVVAGHDYLDGESHNCTFGVKTAVDNFVKVMREISSLNLDLVIIDETWPSWYFIKK